jgi:hypothetical protein
MPKQTGFVDEIKLSRVRGHVKLRPSGDIFQLYWDHDVDMIDPTEMVRRNWMIGLLQQAAVHQGEVDVEYADDKGGGPQGVGKGARAWTRYQEGLGEAGRGHAGERAGDHPRIEPPDPRLGAARAAERS